MSDLVERREMRTRLKREFVQDRDYREVYAGDFLNTSIAMQIRVIRDQRNLTQEQLATMTGTKQTGISRVENVNYSAWNIGTLKKIAFALGARLKVSFETFGSLVDEAARFSREELPRPSLEDDPVFQEDQEHMLSVYALASLENQLEITHQAQSFTKAFFAENLHEQRGWGALQRTPTPSLFASSQQQQRTPAMGM